MADVVLKASDDNKGQSLDHVNLFKSSLSTIFEPCFGRISRKRKKVNLRNIVHTDFLTLCGPKSGTTSAKTKTKNTQISLPSKDARRSQEITKIDYKKDFKSTSTRQCQKDHKKSFLDCGKKSGQRYNRGSMQ